jgi:hypothetical protein
MEEIEELFRGTTEGSGYYADWHFLRPDEVVAKGDMCFISRHIRGNRVFVGCCNNSVGHVLQKYKDERGEPHFYVIRKSQFTKLNNLKD